MGLRLFTSFVLRIALVLCLGCFSQSLLAQQKAQRIALVIGNDSYTKSPALVNARSDARSIAASLQKSGFEVILRTDLNDRGMREAVRQFKARLTGGTEAVFYFSGHGVQVGAGNYLLPIDIAPDSEEQVKDDGLALQKVLDDMAEQKTRFAVAIIDACRDNPFPKVGGRNIGSGKGLAASSPATGQMVLYAAGTGQTALDRLGPTDRTPNGVFTRVLLREMDRPGLPVDRILKNVRQEVVRLAQSVGREQVPALYDQSVGEFYFRGSASTVAEQRLEVAPVGLTEAQKEEKFWDEAKAVGNREAFEAYLSTYPKGRYVSLAKATIARLNVAGAQVASGSNPAPIRPQPPLQTASIAPQPGTVFKDCDDCPEMVTIPAGNFLMGSKGDPFSSDPPNASEQPQHSVSIRSFALGKFEVTQEQWYAVMGTMPSKFKGRTLPVEQVSWEDAQVFVQKLSANTGKKYRLPTEAEWEYAARAGSQTNDYFFDYQTKFARQIQLGLYAWFANNSSTTKPIGQKLPNAFGLHDMQGNVWEWTQDCWNENYNSAPNNGSAWTRGDCSNRVMRGGGWRGDPTFWDVAFRSKDTVTHRNVMVGFRVARDH
jgi:formylglycine-generating enzyme required for sulfatase activity